MVSVGLCQPGHFELSDGFAVVPRFRSLPDFGQAQNLTPSPYREFVTLDHNLTPRVSFNAPYKAIRFGEQLRHGTHVANAAHEFNSTMTNTMVQVYSITNVPLPRTTAAQCSAPFRTNMTQNTGTIIDGSETVVRAFESVLDNPDGIDAINMSIVFRAGFCIRNAGTTAPRSCRENIGQNVVYELLEKGIPIVVGLENKDIGANEETWPACLDGVIKVGNGPATRNSIGVGKMKIDSFAKDTYEANGGGRGNSFAAPRIAASLAMLKTAVPSSTVEQRVKALELAHPRTKTYRAHNRRYTARYVLKEDIPNAIEELKALVKGAIDDIGFEDTEGYGPTFNDSDSGDYTFDVNFDELISVNSKVNLAQAGIASKESTVSTVRDVVLSFDAKMSADLFRRNGFEIFINGIKQETTETFGGERNIEFTFPRTLFNPGKNTLRIAPKFSNRPWGLTNIKAGFTAVIELTLNQLDRNEYGSEQDPEHPTGLRATFSIPDVESDVLFYVTGWGLREADEVKVHLNGAEYGFLQRLNSRSDGYSPQDTFSFAKTDLLEGSNVIEFVQKAGETTWGITNMFVTQDGLAPALPLGVRNTIKYGNNYGTNEHPIRLDATFTASTQHDHNISWQGFDIDEDTDVNVYLNDSLIKSMQKTLNNRLGSRESLTFASRLFRAGENTLSFRVSGDASDSTWGVTGLQVRTSAVIDLENEINLNKDFGYFAKFRSGLPSGWNRTYSGQEYQSRLYATFNSSGTTDKTILVTGWDIDSQDEISVYINGLFLQHMTSSSLSSAYSKTDRLVIPKAQLVPGENSISFRASDTVRGFQNEKWGILFGEAVNGAGLSPIIFLLLSE